MNLNPSQNKQISQVWCNIFEQFVEINELSLLLVAPPKMLLRLFSMDPSPPQKHIVMVLLTLSLRYFETITRKSCKDFFIEQNFVTVLLKLSAI